jgi:hypothetical protein
LQGAKNTVLLMGAFSVHLGYTPKHTTGNAPIYFIKESHKINVFAEIPNAETQKHHAKSAKSLFHVLP